MRRASTENENSTQFWRFAKRFCWQRRLAIANESVKAPDAELFDAIGDVEQSIATNENALQKIVGYGEFPYRLQDRQVMQVFDEEAAKQMVASNQSLWQRFKRSITARFGDARIPIYYRHPDHNPENEDSQVYGRVSDLEARADGLYGRIEWLPAANELLRSVRNLKISPRWTMRALDDAVTRLAPQRLLSLGLTNFPNIATAVAVNSNPNPKMNEVLKKLLAALGFSNERIQQTTDGGADAVSISEAQEKLAALQAAANEASQVADLQSQVTALTAERDTAQAELAAANERLTASQTARAEQLVTAAANEGRIKPADKDIWTQRLIEATDFATAANELAALKPAMKTTPTTGGLAAKQAEELTAANEFRGKVDKLIAGGVPFAEAWQSAKHAHADLFARAYPQK